MRRCEQERYKIKGKTYYKVGEEKVNEGDRCFIGCIWLMKNPSNEDFKLLIAPNNKRFTLYSIDGKTIARTYSISKIQ